MPINKKGDIKKKGKDKISHDFMPKNTYFLVNNSKIFFLTI